MQNVTDIKKPDTAALWHKVPGKTVMSTRYHLHAHHEHKLSTDVPIAVHSVTNMGNKIMVFWDITSFKVMSAKVMVEHLVPSFKVLEGGSGGPIKCLYLVIKPYGTTPHKTTVVTFTGDGTRNTNRETNPTPVHMLP
jgi:hypothetical protein